MKNNNICDYEGCRKPARSDRFVYGRAYCEDHYPAGLEKALLHSIAHGEASRKFLNIFGRYLEGLYTVKNLPVPKRLAANKIRDRTGDDIDQECWLLTSAVVVSIKFVAWISRLYRPCDSFNFDSILEGLDRLEEHIFSDGATRPIIFEPTGLALIS